MEEAKRKKRTALEDYGIKIEDELLTVNDVAKVLKTSESTVYRLINAGRLPFLKLGRVKVRKSSLLKFMEMYEGTDVSDPENVTYLEKVYQ